MDVSSFSIESIDTWFGTLYLVRVELRRALSLLYMCFGKGLVAF